MAYGWPKGSDRRWRKIRDFKLQRSPMCERCENEPAVDVHHKTPLAAGGHRYAPYEELESLCRRCHNIRHGARRTGCDLDGYPLD